MLRIQLLGQPRMLFEDDPLPLSGRPKVLPLLAYVLLQREAPVSRAGVANALWPDQTEADARANLRRHLHYLGALLPPADLSRPWICATATTIRWNPANSYRLDVAEFEQAAASPDSFATAAQLYGGDLLNDADEEWIVPVRARLREKHLQVLAALVRGLRAARAYDRALPYAHALLATEPWREDIVRQLLLILYERGDRAGAMLAYERFADSIRAELGAEPMVETASVYEAIARGVNPPGALQVPEIRDEVPGPAAILPFSGRDSELQAICARWNQAAGGVGQTLFIGGEAGVGKTRLLREFAAQCEGQGGRIIVGGTSSPEFTPYQAVAAILRSSVHLIATAGVDKVWLAALAPLVPEFERHPDDAAIARANPVRERQRLFEACAVVLEALGKRAATCFAIEDVHWAGAATLELLEYLAHRLRAAPAFLLITYREEEIDRLHPLRAFRRRCERDGIAVHLALPRLSRAAVKAMVLQAADDVPATQTLANGLYERSEGNPFFIAQLVRGLFESAALRMSEGRWSLSEGRLDPLPAEISHSLDARLDRLDERSRTLADVAAVVGRAFDVELLRETTGWPEATVLDALGTLVDRHIVSEDERRGRFDYAFTHQLIQDAVYARIDSVQRARRHRRVARVMCELYAGETETASAEIARHFDRAGEPELAAQHYAGAASGALALFAVEDAARDAERALALTTDARLSFDVLLLLERAASLRGERDAQGDALTRLEGLIAILDDDDLACTVLRRRIDFANLRSDRDGELKALELLRERVRRSGSQRWETEVLEAEARRLRTMGEFAAARAAFEKLTALSYKTGDRRRYLAGRFAHADCYIFEGRLQEARVALEELRALLDMRADQDEFVRMLIAFSRAALAQQDYDAMSGFAREALDISQRIGDREGEALAAHTIANGRVYAFEVREAREGYARALEIYEQIDHNIGRASIFADSGLFYTEIGLLDRALELFRRAEELAQRINFTWVNCIANVNAAYCHRLRGDAAAAKQAALRALALARTMESRQLEAAALGTLGVAEIELGELAAATEHLGAGVALRRPSGPTPRLGDNLCGLARAYLRAGDLDRAAASSAELMSLYDANPRLAPQPTEWLATAAAVARARGENEAAERLCAQATAVMRERALAIDEDETRAAFLALPFNAALLAAGTATSGAARDEPRTPS